jgi:nucleoside-diphosphate-sugar epimerase
MASSEERAFVAGATGLTGRFVVETLRARGIATVAHVRPDSPRLGQWRARFEALGADVDATAWEPTAIRATITARAPTHVFALLGTTRARAARAAKAGADPSRESYDAVDVALTEQLLDASAAIDPRPRFVYLSSIGAGASARGSYLEARTRVEASLIRSGVPYTIARPSFIVGERDDARPAEKLGSPVADALLGAIGMLGARRTADRYRSIRGEDLARALVSASLDPAAKNQILEAGALQALARR